MYEYGPHELCRAPQLASHSVIKFLGKRSNAKLPSHSALPLTNGSKILRKRVHCILGMHELVVRWRYHATKYS